MSIVFRNLDANEKKELRESVSFWIESSKVNKILTNYRFFVGEGRWKELFITNNKVKVILDKNTNISPYSIGMGFGEFREKGLNISLSGASMIAQHSNRAIKVNEKAESLFLYRRNILCQSILEINNDLEIDEKVLVVNEHNDFLGIGQLKISPQRVFLEKYENQLAIKNLMDLGWYLRKGK
ncbi:MAG: NIP7 pre-PUA domain-containing protein [Candidatus Heimdallarchaeota archaeon]